MARAGKLKVYCMPAGFHDAYVAAPSQKAALEAWGSEHDLFARGIAHVVTDPALTEEPLARPGEVVKRLRGTADEQMAALPPDRPKRRASPEEERQDRGPPKRTRAAKAASKPAPKPHRKPKPRPSRAALDEVEAALADIEARHRAESKALVEKEAELARERKRLSQAQEGERSKAERDVAREEERYRAALGRWRAAAGGEDV